MKEIEQGQYCWFCEKELASDSHAFEKRMRKKVGSHQTIGQGTRTLYFDEKIVKIPRCENCAKIHLSNRYSLLGMGCITLILASVILFTALNNIVDYVKDGNFSVVIVGAVILFVLVLAIAFGIARLVTWIRYRDVLVGKKMKSDFEITINKYPEVSRLRKQGFIN
jgi:hypothetical protein